MVYRSYEYIASITTLFNLKYIYVIGKQIKHKIVTLIKYPSNSKVKAHS